MNELNQKLWAVKSERGREASGITYEEAARLIHELRKQKIYGLSIITNEAARRLAEMNNKEDAPQNPLRHETQ